MDVKPPRHSPSERQNPHETRSASSRLMHLEAGKQGETWKVVLSGGYLYRNVRNASGVDLCRHLTSSIKAKKINDKTGDQPTIIIVYALNSVAPTTAISCNVGTIFAKKSDS